MSERGFQTMTDNSKKRRARAAVLTAVVAAAVTAALAGCSTSSPAASPPPPTFTVTTTPGSSEPTITLTQLGANRIGLETAKVAVGRSGEATLPYSALLYEPNGQAAVYVSTGTLSFQRAFVTVDTITGNTVTVTAGVTPGQRVATDGAEELLGAQNGVGEET
jgi:multidrug efflux pump subunit AcrA (membrane-fusion protein)